MLGYHGNSELLHKVFNAHSQFMDQKEQVSDQCWPVCHTLRNTALEENFLSASTLRVFFWVLFVVHWFFSPRGVPSAWVTSWAQLWPLSFPAALLCHWEACPKSCWQAVEGWSWLAATSLLLVGRARASCTATRGLSSSFLDSVGTHGFSDPQQSGYQGKKQSWELLGSWAIVKERAVTTWGQLLNTKV